MSMSPEFSRPIAIEGIIHDKDRKERVEATEAECAALAQRFDLRSLSGLKASLTIRRVSEGNIMKIEGDIQADVVQACVVSLQDVPAEIKMHFDTYFTEDGKGFEQDQAFSIELEEELHEVISDGQLDLGELVAQYLSLEIEPYPRAPGVSLAAQLAEVGHKVTNNPFDVLKGLKSDKKD